MSNKKQKVLSFVILAVLGLALLLGVILAVPNGIEIPDVAVAAEGDTLINITNSEVLHWAVEGSSVSSNSNLRDGKIYEYMYSDSTGSHFYYSIVRLEQSPNANWTNWRTSGIFNKKYSIMRFRQSGYEHKIAIHSALLGSTANETDKGFWVEYSQTTMATEMGQYVAKAVLHANDGYIFSTSDNPRATLSERGIDIEIDPDGKRAEMTKVWYIVNFDNALLNGTESIKTHSEVEFTIPSWKFGDDISIDYPWLYHGDGALNRDMDLNDSYQVKVKTGSSDNIEDYEEIIENIVMTGRTRNVDILDEWNPTKPNDQLYDIVTFTLTSADGSTTYTINSNGQNEEIRSRWSYYINQYMPVGDYKLTIHVKDIALTSHKHWWEENGDVHEVIGQSESIYRGFERTFNFSVTPGDLKITSDTEALLKSDQMQPVNIDNIGIGAQYNYTSVFQSEQKYLKYEYAYSNITDWSTIKTFWTDTEAKRELYFDTEPHLEYNLYRMGNDRYFKAISSEWAKWITTPSTYTVYYMAKMKNYSSYPSIEDRYDKFYTVVVFKNVPVPSLNRTDPKTGKTELVYTGGELSVDPVDPTGGSVQPSDRDRSLYNWRGNTGTNVGEYTATFVLNDPSHYKWFSDSKDDFRFNDSYEIKWNIVPAKVAVPEIAERVWRGENTFVKPAITIPANQITQNPLFRYEYPEGTDSRGFADAGEYDISLTLNDTRNYVWEKDDEQNTGKVNVKFVVSPAQNIWSVNPRINQWEWSSYDRTKNLIEGAAIYGQVVFDICTNKDGSGPIIQNITLENGVVNQDVATELAKLNSGKYYLIGQVKVVGKSNWTAIKPESVEFNVATATNRWVSVPNIIRWKYDGFDPTINVITASPLHGSQVKLSIISSKGSTEADDIAVEGLENLIINSDGVVQGNAVNILKGLAGGNNKTYWLKAVVEQQVAATVGGKPVYNYTGLTQYVEFRIQQSNNYWTQTPNIARWIDGQLTEETMIDHLPIGTAMWGSPVFVIIRESNGEVLFDSASGLNKLEEAKPGWHVLRSSVQGNESYTALSSELRFQVFSTDVNFWNTVPNIQSWTEGNTPNAPVSKSAFGNVEYKYYAKDDYIANGVNATALSGAPNVAGEYVLVATAISDEHTDLVAAVNFTVFEKEKIGATTYIAIIAVLAVLTAVGIALTIVFALKGKKNAPKLATANGADVSADAEVEAEIIDDATASDVSSDTVEEEEQEAIEPSYID